MKPERFFVRRALLAALPALLLLAAAALFLGFGETGGAGPAPQPAGGLTQAALNHRETDRDPGRITVTVSYSTTPTGSLVQRSLSFSGPQDLIALTPENVSGFHFYWMDDGQVWDKSSLREGATYTGLWVSVYQVTVY